MLRAVHNLAPTFKYVGEYTWATLPSAASYSGYRARVTDVGISPGMPVVSDGTRWIPDGPQVLARSAVGVSGAADTNENILATVTLPAGILGRNGSLRVFSTWEYTNSANNKVLRQRLGGIGGTRIFELTNTTSLLCSDVRQIQNVNAANSQVASLNFQSGIGLIGASGAAATTAAVDTSAEVSYVFTGQKASAGETLTLTRYLVEILP